MGPFETKYDAATTPTGFFFLGEQGDETKVLSASLLAGSFTVASEAEARAGSNNTKGMTPLRTAQAIQELAIGELTVLADSTSLTLSTNLSGVAATLPLATTGNAGLLAPAEKTTLNGLAAALVLKADKTELLGLLDYKGNKDCAANPNYPASSLKGDVHRVSVAGKIGGSLGKVVSLGDAIVCLADNAGGTEASVGTSWEVWEGNIPGITAAGLALLTAANAAAQRAAMEAAASSHTHSLGDVIGLEEALEALEGGGGGGSMVDTDVAYLDETGNDTTGDGTAGNPWRTPQHAYDQGCKIMRAGQGGFGPISGDVLDLHLIGLGSGLTIFGNITGKSGYVKGNGKGAVSCGDIYIAAESGAAGGDGSHGSSGAPMSAVYVQHLKATSISIYGGAGGPGGMGFSGNESMAGSVGGSGGGGGDGAALYVQYCIISGNAQSYAGSGGSGGNGGNDGGAGQGNGGNGGNAGNPGSVILLHSELGGYAAAPYGTGGAEGSGASSGTPGSGSGSGSIYTTQSNHAAAIYSESVTAVASVIGGVFTAS